MLLCVRRNIFKVNHMHLKMTLLAVLALLPSLSSLAQNPPDKYYCEVKTEGDPLHEGYVLYRSKSKFRVVSMLRYFKPVRTNQPLSPIQKEASKFPESQPYTLISISDDASPWTIWEYSIKPSAWQGRFPGSDHEAFLSTYSVQYRVCELARQIGIDKVQTQYGVTGLTRNKIVATPKQCDRFWLKRYEDSPIKNRYVKVESAVVAGMRCDGYKLVSKLDSGKQTSTIFVEPRSSYILKEHTVFEFNSSISPKASGFEATKFNLNVPMSETLFQLPAGLAVHLPEAFKNTRLPARTRIVLDNGLAGKIGRDIQF